MKYFNEETDKWFDKVSEVKLNVAKRSDLIFALSKAPTKAGLGKVINVLKNIPAMSEVLQTAEDIMSGEFGHEFRYRYHKSSTDYPGKVSAASSFFSILRQALNYTK